MWRSPARLLAVLAAVVVVVGAAIAVPAITVQRPQAVDGDVALPTEGGTQVAERPAVDAASEAADDDRPPWYVGCRRDGEPVDCVAWNTDVGGSSGSAGPGSSGAVGRFGRIALAVSGTLLTAVDDPTGRRPWQRDMGAGIDSVRMESGLVGVQADDRLVLLSAASGVEEWTVDVDGSVVGELLYGGLVFSAAAPAEGAARDVDAPPVLVARRVEDGAVTWRWEPPSSWADGPETRPGTRPPLVLEQFDDRHVLVQFRGAGVAVLDARTGELAWQRDGVHRLGADERGVVVLETGRGMEPTGPEEDVAPPTAVMLLDPATGEVRWREESVERTAWVGVQADLVLVPSAAGLHALDRATGEERWAIEQREHPRVPLRGSGASGGPADPAVVVTVVEATGQLLGRDVSTGAVLWSAGTRRQGALVVPTGDWVVVDTDGGGLEYIDRATGETELFVVANGHLTPSSRDPALLYDLRTRHLVRLDDEALDRG